MDEQGWYTACGVVYLVENVTAAHAQVVYDAKRVYGVDESMVEFAVVIKMGR